MGNLPNCRTGRELRRCGVRCVGRGRGVRGRGGADVGWFGLKCAEATGNAHDARKLRQPAAPGTGLEPDGKTFGGVLERWFAEVAHDGLEVIAARPDDAAAAGQLGRAVPDVGEHVRVNAAPVA